MRVLLTAAIAAIPTIVSYLHRKGSAITHSSLYVTGLIEGFGGLMLILAG